MKLVVGNQHSYSDVCRLTGGEILHAGNRTGGFDRDRGELRVEAGATIADVLRRIRRDGWFLPVVPGTQYATIGGCVANDVHGKNHQTAGSFGNHVLALGLERTDAKRALRVTPGDPLFHATVGGLGLTGKITTVDLRLIRQAKVFKPYYFPLDYTPYWWLFRQAHCLQYQCILPSRDVPTLLRQVTQRPAVTSRKIFGDIPSVGMLSFPRKGFGIAMDFFDYGPSTLRMFDKLDTVVKNDPWGALYPAKTRMSREMFRHSFPRWKEFTKYVDPEFSSDFWQRVK